MKNLLSEEEAKFLYHVAFCFAFKHSGNTAFNAFSSIRSFITHGVFIHLALTEERFSFGREDNSVVICYSLCPTGGVRLKILLLTDYCFCFFLCCCCVVIVNNDYL